MLRLERGFPGNTKVALASAANDPAVGGDVSLRGWGCTDRVGQSTSIPDQQNALLQQVSAQICPAAALCAQPSTTRGACRGGRGGRGGPPTVRGPFQGASSATVRSTRR